MGFFFSQQSPVFEGKGSGCILPGCFSGRVSHRVAISVKTWLSPGVVGFERGHKYPWWNPQSFITYSLRSDINYFSHGLCVRSQLLNPAHTQREGITQGCGHQGQGSLGAFLEAAHWASPLAQNRQGYWHNRLFKRRWFEYQRWKSSPQETDEILEYFCKNIPFYLPVLECKMKEDILCYIILSNS